MAKIPLNGVRRSGKSIFQGVMRFAGNSAGVLILLHRTEEISFGVPAGSPPARQCTVRFLIERPPGRQFIIVQGNRCNVMSEQQQESILIVEDDFIVAKVIEKNLLELGYGVAGLVADGDEAVAKATCERPDLVLMDIHLQGRTDGVSAAEQIHASLDIPVVFLTAFSDQPTFERALVASPYGYIVKPFSRNTLATTIRVALNRKKADQKKTDRHFWLDSTMSMLSEGIITIGTNGRIILINQAAEIMTGWTNPEANGKLLDQVLTFRDPINGDLFHYDSTPIIREGIIGTIPENSLVLSRENASFPVEESFAKPIRTSGDTIRGAVIILYPAERSSAPDSRKSGRTGGEARVSEISIAFEHQCGKVPSPSVPFDAAGWDDRGNCCLFLRRYTDAADAYRNAVSLNPLSYQSWFGLGIALDKLGKDTEAFEAYDKALSIYPRNPRILDAKGVLLKRNGRDADAERCFELARLYAS